MAKKTAVKKKLTLKEQLAEALKQVTSLKASKTRLSNKLAKANKALASSAQQVEKLETDVSAEVSLRESAEKKCKTLSDENTELLSSVARYATENAGVKAALQVNKQEVFDLGFKLTELEGVKGRFDILSEERGVLQHSSTSGVTQNLLNVDVIANQDVFIAYQKTENELLLRQGEINENQLAYLITSTKAIGEKMAVALSEKLTVAEDRTEKMEEIVRGVILLLESFLDEDPTNEVLVRFYKAYLDFVLSYHKKFGVMLNT